MIRFTLSTTVAFAICFLPLQVGAYEVINHQEMSETAAKLSGLGRDQAVTPNGGSGKLFRLGLRQQNLLGDTVEEKNKFQTFPKSGASTEECAFGTLPLSIRDLIRFGSCYEDLAEVGAFRSLAHFYNPQNGGAGSTLALSSPNWSFN